MKEIDLAYAAGIIDGEGCVSVKNKKKNGISIPCIYLAMADKELILWFQEYFNGGYIALVKKQKPHYKQQYRWVVEGQKCLTILQLLLPYLRGKKPQAVELLTWPEIKMFRGRPLSEEDVLKRASITQKLKDLKRLV
jgi:hypothetical protein